MTQFLRGRNVLALSRTLMFGYRTLFRKAGISRGVIVGESKDTSVYRSRSSRATSILVDRSWTAKRAYTDDQNQNPSKPSKTKVFKNLIVILNPFPDSYI